MFGVAGVVVTSKAFLAAAWGNVGQLQPLCVAGKDVPFVVQLDELRELKLRELDVGCLRAAIVVAQRCHVLNHLHCW